ncbi:hypothetical protein QA596_04345 [Balneolales bacterium ANBcel1]|nr:hypothetical protein [Balneolales bacterium ANBcel1]
MANNLWKITARPPHDFFLCLDVESYFDHEHQPERILDEGFTRPLPLPERDILVTIHFNGNPENPEFTVNAHDSLTETEREAADDTVRRILGTDIDLAPFYEQAADDPVLAPLFQELYGLKRVSRAHLFEDAVNRIIRTQIKHKPTARRMVYDVRSAYGTRLETSKGMIPAWPRPERLVSADPSSMMKHGLSRRKGEYLTGLAHELLHGELAGTHGNSGGSVHQALKKLENMPPVKFYEKMVSIRGIGPTTAQDLMLFRNRSDGVFPSNRERGREKALRRWIILSYGGNPDRCTEEAFQEMIRMWQGYEAAALEFLYVGWVLSEKRSLSQ